MNRRQQDWCRPTSKQQLTDSIDRGALLISDLFNAKAIQRYECSAITDTFQICRHLVNPCSPDEYDRAILEHVADAVEKDAARIDRLRFVA